MESILTVLHYYAYYATHVHANYSPFELLFEKLSYTSYEGIREPKTQSKLDIKNIELKQKLNYLQQNAQK